MEKVYKRTYTEDWDFKDVNTKEFTHIYHSYPAMMIPQIARKLIAEYAPLDKKLDLIFDPYMGSGTTLVESKIKNINSIGTDINPLARLISETKTSYFNLDDVFNTFKIIKDNILNYSNKDISYKKDNITNIYFWYNKENIAELNFLSNIIESFDISIKNFFKIPLSECIREVSFTRNGEFKRYRMEKEKISSFKPNTFKIFIEKIERNICGLQNFLEKKSEAFSLIKSFNSVYEIPDNIISTNSVDLVVTSPPYGDSRTTVAYGQFSRWSNEWFNFNNAKDLDKYLMGGKKVENLDINPKSIISELNKIKLIDEKRYYEVMYFLNDYYNSISNVSKVVRKGGRVCYVVGNRTVKGIQISLDYFTVEMFEKNGFFHIDTFVRKIPNKRMPSKTSPSNKKGNNVSTMINEYIVILEKK